MTILHSAIYLPQQSFTGRGLPWQNFTGAGACGNIP
uniref:Uncharacterized protein n=1 Tax=Arundo donax TaxID=35708 RepID=A0A0A9I3Q4_ARUDO